ncbi:MULTISPECIES: helix-turn-helix transcriptional regulator [Burkholderia]|uniref:helix-turn-helix transcriptional regulator n=1 Tax=Burkholderia TaxID=32008 RepID=UPI000F582133|nr:MULTISPECIES: helix-turn-helix domain-containing protein [Burkholderia]
MSTTFQKSAGGTQTSESPLMAATTVAGSKRRSNGHVKAEPPSISLNQPGLLSTANVMAILGVKSPTTITTMIRERRFPPPTLKIGRRPKWHTSVVLTFLEGQVPTDQPHWSQVSPPTKKTV